jgi:hypothetical protein
MNPLFRISFSKKKRTVRKMLSKRTPGSKRKCAESVLRYISEISMNDAFQVLQFIMKFTALGKLVCFSVLSDQTGFPSRSSLFSSFWCELERAESIYRECGLFYNSLPYKMKPLFLAIFATKMPLRLLKSYHFNCSEDQVRYAKTKHCAVSDENEERDPSAFALLRDSANYFLYHHSQPSRLWKWATSIPFTDSFLPSFSLSEIESQVRETATEGGAERLSEKSGDEEPVSQSQTSRAEPLNAYRKRHEKKGRNLLRGSARQNDEEIGVEENVENMAEQEMEVTMAREHDESAEQTGDATPEQRTRRAMAREHEESAQETGDATPERRTSRAMAREHEESAQQTGDATPERRTTRAMAREHEESAQQTGDATPDGSYSESTDSMDLEECGPSAGRKKRRTGSWNLDSSDDEYNLHQEDPVPRRRLRLQPPLLDHTVESDDAATLQLSIPFSRVHPAPETCSFVDPTFIDDGTDRFLPSAPALQRVVRRRKHNFQYVNVRTVNQPLRDLYTAWIHQRTTAGLSTKFSLSSFYRLARRRYEHPKRRTDLCDYCLAFKKWKDNTDLTNATAEEKLQLSSYEEHEKTVAEQRKTFNSSISQVPDGECVIVADFAEKIRLPIKLETCSNDFYHYQTISCLTFVIYWNDGPTRRRLHCFYLHFNTVSLSPWTFSFFF